MNWILEVAGTAVSTIVGAMVYWYLTSQANSEPQSNHFRTVLRMNRLYLVFGVVGVTLGAVSFAVMFFEEFHKEQSTWILLAALNSAIFFGAGLPSVMYYRNHKVIFTHHDFLVVDVWGESQSVQWSEVVSIDLSKWTGLNRLRTQTGEVVSVHSHLVGVNVFLKTINERSSLL